MAAQKKKSNISGPGLGIYGDFAEFDNSGNFTGIKNTNTPAPAPQPQQSSYNQSISGLNTSAEYQPNELAAFVGDGDTWHGKEFTYAGSKYKIIDTGHGTRRIEAVGSASPAQSGPATADDIINEQINRIKEQASFLKDFQTSNPFAYDEVLAKQVAQEKYKPYYEELLSDFVTPLQTKIAQSKEDEQTVVDEIVRRRNFQTDEFKKDFSKALDLSRGGFAGAGILGSGAANRELSQTELRNESKLGDFTASSMFDENQTRVKEDRLQEEALRNIEQKKRDVFGQGRAFDTSVVQDVEQGKTTAEKQYQLRALDAVSSRFGAPLLDVPNFLDFTA